MAMKNMCKILIFRPPTVGKLLSFLNTGWDSGGRREGGAAERQQGWKVAFDCTYTYVWGILAFIFIFWKVLSLTLGNGKERCKNMKFEDFLWNSQFLINSLTSYVIEY